MSIVVKIQIKQSDNSRICCFGCGCEFVERDENGAPVRWNICHDCPHRQPWHLSVNDENTRGEGA